jgi:hypothetical protein
MPGIKVTDNEIVFSQSWVNTFLNCPEQARLEMVGELPRVESDATAIGSALHAGVEHVLRGHSMDAGWECANDTLSELIAQPNFEWKQLKTEDGVRIALERVYWEWQNEIYPQLPDTMAVEFPFDIVVTTIKDRVIRIKGAIDYVGIGPDNVLEIWDWKTAASFRNWQQWEVDRFKIQPTFYSLGLLMSTSPEQLSTDQITFIYAVMSKSRQEHSLYTTQRGPADWAWLTQQLTSITHLIDADLPSWPMRDQHALCSPKWCTAWDSCKGMHYR